MVYQRAKLGMLSSGFFRSFFEEGLSCKTAGLKALRMNDLTWQGFMGKLSLSSGLV